MSISLYAFSIPSIEKYGIPEQFCLNPAAFVGSAGLRFVSSRLRFIPFGSFPALIALWRLKPFYCSSASAQAIGMKGEVMTKKLLIPVLICALSVGMPLTALATCDMGTGNTRDGKSISVWARNQNSAENWQWINNGSRVDLTEKYEKIDKYSVKVDKQEDHFNFTNGAVTYRCTIKASRKSDGGNSAGGTMRINSVSCSLKSGDPDTAPPGPECSKNYKQDGGDEFRVNFSFENQAASRQIHTSHGEFQSGSSDESSRESSGHPRQ